MKSSLDELLIFFQNYVTELETLILILKEANYDSVNRKNWLNNLIFMRNNLILNLNFFNYMLRKIYLDAK